MGERLAICYPLLRARSHGHVASRRRIGAVKAIMAQVRLCDSGRAGRTRGRLPRTGMRRAC
jgi:hypothetical protein